MNGVRRGNPRPLLLAGFAVAMGGFQVTAPARAEDPKVAVEVREPVAADLNFAVVEETNRVRSAAELRQLRLMSGLAGAAEDLAAANALRLDLSHGSALAGQATLGERLAHRRTEPETAAENVGIVALPADAKSVDASDVARRLVAGWMESPGHRANILDGTMTHIGTAVQLVRGPRGRWYAYGVQVFGRFTHRSRTRADGLLGPDVVPQQLH